MSDFDFLDVNDLPEEHAAEFSPDSIQFLFGQKNAPGVIGTGGFFAKSEVFGQRLVGADEITYEFEASSEAGFMFEELNFCVLAQVTLWATGGGNTGEPYILYKNYVPGSKSDTRILAIVKEFGDWEPIELGLGGKVRSVGWDNSVKLFRQKIIKPVSNAKKRSIPDYTFWMPIKAGPPEVLDGYSVRITPPILSIPDGSTKDVLKTLYVGPELTQVIASTLWDEAQRWKQKTMELAIEPLKNDKSEIDLLNEAFPRPE